VLLVEMKNFVPTAADIECIDDRRKNSPDEYLLGSLTRLERRTPVSFPGGALGLCAAILGTLNVSLMRAWQDAGDARYKLAQKKFAFKRLMPIFETALGGMSCHTDDHHAQNPMACAGCGHAKAFLDQGYGLGETYRKELKDYATKLKARAQRKESGIVVFSYKGDHNARAVFRIISSPGLGKYLSVSPNDGANKVFIVNEVMGLYLLERLSRALYEELRSDFEELGVSHRELWAHVQSQFLRHVRLSAHKLAHGLPVYDIKEEDGLIVVSNSSIKY
jgi:hypothetical protein